ncbi:MAG: hypothetical protein AAF563_12565 [Pseudomonadota bacterium]
MVVTSGLLFCLAVLCTAACSQPAFEAEEAERFTHGDGSDGITIKARDCFYSALISKTDCSYSDPEPLAAEYCSGLGKTAELYHVTADRNYYVYKCL